MIKKWLKIILNAKTHRLQRRFILCSSGHGCARTTSRLCPYNAPRGDHTTRCSIWVYFARYCGHNGRNCCTLKPLFRRKSFIECQWVKYLTTLTILNGDWPWFIRISVGVHACMHMHIFFGFSWVNKFIVFRHTHPGWQRHERSVAIMAATNWRRTISIHVKYAGQTVSFRLWYDPIPAKSNIGIYDVDTLFLYLYLQLFESLCHNWLNKVRQNICPKPSPAWASYQTRNIAGCTCTGNAGNVFSDTYFKGNRWFVIPACITARSWRQAVMHVVIANPRWRGKRSRHSRRTRNLQFHVSGKRPMVE